MSRSQHTILTKCLSSGLLVSKLVPASHSHAEKSWFWSKCRVTVLTSISVFFLYLNASVTGTLSQNYRGEKVERETYNHTSLPEIGQRRPEMERSPLIRKLLTEQERKRSQHFEANPVPFPAYPATSPKAQGQGVEGWPVWHVSCQGIKVTLTLSLSDSHSTHSQWESSLFLLSTVRVPAQCLLLRSSY